MSDSRLRSVVAALEAWTKRKIRGLVPWVVVISVILGVVFTMRAVNRDRQDQFTEDLTEQDEDFVPNDRLRPLSDGAGDEEGMVEVARNDLIVLFADPSSGHVAFESTESGVRWSSLPPREAIEREERTGTWRENIESPVIAEHVSGFEEVSLRMTNTVRSEVELSAFAREDGVRFVVDFVDENFTIGYEVRLRDDHVRLVIPSDLVADREGRLLLRYQVLPFLASARTDMSEGYLLVPDGSGGIISFDETRRYTDSYTGQVYGRDFAREAAYRDVREAQRVRVPAFGIQRDGQSLLGVIHSGGESSHILGVPAGVRNGFNFVVPRFDHRFRYRVVQDLLGASYSRVSGTTNDVRREILYYPLHEPDREGYVTLAHGLQRYFTETLGIEQVDHPGAPPLHVTLFAGIETDAFLGTSFVPMTTFPEAERILTRISDAGVENASVTVRNWEGIHEWRGQPEKLPPAARLGGADGLGSLGALAAEVGYDVLLVGDYSTGGTRGGYGSQSDTVHTILREPVSLFHTVDSGVYMLVPEVSRENVISDLQSLLPLGVSGLLFENIGSELSSDYNPRTQRSRAGMARFYGNLMGEIRSDDVLVHMSDPNMYMLPHTDAVSFSYDGYPHMMSGSFLEVIERQVPFLPIALHGLIPYTNNYYNLFDEARPQFMRALEYGANVGFLITERSPAELRLTDAVERTALPSTRFDLLFETVIDRYGEIYALRNELAGSRIVDHRVEGEIHTTHYEGGDVLVFNYGGEDYEYNGATIPAENYSLVRLDAAGEGQQ